MKIKDAVAQRIIDLCKEKNIAINALGNISGVNPSTIYSILNTKSQNPGVVTPVSYTHLTLPTKA